MIEVVLVQRNLVDNQDGNSKRYYLLKGKNYNDFINGENFMIDQLIMIEKYMSFTINNKLSFIDSFQFLSSS